MKPWTTTDDTSMSSVGRSSELFIGSLLEESLSSRPIPSGSDLELKDFDRTVPMQAYCGDVLKEKSGTGSIGL